MRFRYGRLAQRMAKLEEKLYEARQRNARLEQENARLRAEAERLGKENSQLQQQSAAARKNSSTSSKPPSSDIVKPKKPRGKGGKKRKRGGQPERQRHERPEFPPEMAGEFFSRTLDSRPDCGGGLLFSRKADPRVVQQAELIDSPLKITEYKMPAYWRPQRNGPALVRAHLDNHRHLRAARPLGLRVLVGIGRISSSRCSPALAPPVRRLTALFHHPPVATHRGSVVGVCDPRERLQKSGCVSSPTNLTHPPTPKTYCTPTSAPPWTSNSCHIGRKRKQTVTFRLAGGVRVRVRGRPDPGAEGASPAAKRQGGQPA